MKLTRTLLGYLNRVFDKSPDPFVAIRVRYDGGLVWTVAEGVLTLAVTGGTGSSVSYVLKDYSLGGLVTAIASRAGFSVVFADSERRNLSARVLLDGSGNPAQSNGDALLGYTSLLWALMEAWSVELQLLRDRIADAPKQMSTTTASGYWLDEIGSYYNVPRTPGEADEAYGARIIAERLRPVSNNVAIENAIEHFTGQSCTVTDVVLYLGLFPVYDGAIDHDATYNYDTVGLPNYGLFDVVVGYDLIQGGEITTFLADMTVIVERLRAAGTHLRTLALSTTSGPLLDANPAPTDAFGQLTVSTALTDNVAAPTDIFATLVMGMEPISDSVPKPTELTSGDVFTVLRTDTGVIITDTGGDPILASVESLFN